jgi:soluble lytic murein transglycosylase-like protein
MDRQLVKTAGLFALVCSLSCSLRNPAITADPAPPPEPKVQTQQRPVAVDRLVARLSRYQMRLSAAEIEMTARTILEESKRWKLDPELVMAVIRVESAYNNFATSRVGALGLMQVMPRTGQAMASRLGIEWRGPKTLFDPVVNVKIGTAYLARMYARYGRWDRALAAYNWGPGRIDDRINAGRAIPARYVKQVNEALEVHSVARR